MKGQRGGQPPFLGWGLVQDCSKTINYKPKDASLLLFLNHKPKDEIVSLLQLYL
jgi:hypothetical protein